jgi:choline kinase
MVNDRPKCLATINGRTLLARQIHSLRAGGITEVGIVAGYRAEALAPYGDRTFINPAWASTGIVASLSCASRWLEEAPVIVSYGDIFYGPETVRALSQASRPLVLAYDPHWLSLWTMRFADPHSDAETFALDGARVVDIGGRIPAGETPEGQYMGLFRVDPQGWQQLKAAISRLPQASAGAIDMTSLLQTALRQGVRIEARPRIENWGEVDHPSDIALYERLYPEI